MTELEREAKKAMGGGGERGGRLVWSLHHRTHRRGGGGRWVLGSPKVMWFGDGELGCRRFVLSGRSVNQQGEALEVRGFSGMF